MSDDSTIGKKVEVVPYNPEWPKIFLDEAERIKKALGENCIALHHVGSTSVPELAAKPKIDIIAVVHDLSLPGHQLDVLEYSDRGGFNIPFRRSFTLRSSLKSVNLHIFEENDPEIELNILFRDYLRGHNEARKQYEAIKYDLISKESSHQKNNSIYYRRYTLDKHAFIQNILKQTGFNRLRFVLCAHDEEWEAAKIFRQKYISDSGSILDPHDETFNQLEHSHLILYYGTNIIGYADLQYLQERSAVIRYFVIEEAFRNQGFGHQFLVLCEKWLKTKNYRSLHIDSSLKEQAFYKKNGYVEMPFQDPERRASHSQNIQMGKNL